MCTQTNAYILGEDYLLPGDDWGGHSLHLTGKEYLSPSDVVNISRWHEDHRSWEKTKNNPLPWLVGSPTLASEGLQEAL